MTNPDSLLQKVMGDFELFCKNFIEINTNDGTREKLILNEAQKDINDLLKMNRQIVLPKSRQAGVTTMMLAMSLWKACTVPNHSIMIVSYLGASAKQLFDKLKDMNQSLPRHKYPNIFPEVKRENRTELLFKNGSKITSTVAGDKDIGRGETIDFCLLSELAFYNDIDRQLLSVSQSMAKGEHSRLIIESTAKGMNSFHKLCMAADKGHSRYKLYFINWYHKLYLQQFKNEIDEADKWFRATNKGNKMSSKDLDEDERLLHEKGATLRQLSWRRFKLLDMELESFHQEYPSNLYEAFVNSSGNTLFNQSKILERMEYIIPPLDRDELTGVLPEPLIKFIGRGLEIYHLPKRGKRYYSGVDVAAGVGGDNSTMSMIDDDGNQVMSFYSNKVSPHDFAGVIDQIGRWFNYSYLCVERNSYGSVVLEQLRNTFGYENMYKMKQFDERGKRKLKLGFLTTEGSKKIAISLFRQNFETGMVNINCKSTLEEMTIFIEKDGKLGNRKSGGNKDDLVISMTLANVAMAEGKWYV
ncbi:DNA packaging protein [Sporosarcina limicola]|uniref:Terminase large subunit gp17-like C-terminal domain-containing protein n=1 Tax=Sporosarcina limicola TaxID=34101 RepID=A0A927RH16_9BACL|nr:DNA packaging protein [Sporosarcina limicola]MBE1557027.1 hypothetical protein [Sporosarcina limicola]